MSIPLAYPLEPINPRNTYQEEFTAPRSPPLPPTYYPPVFEKYDMNTSHSKNGKWFWLNDNIRNHVITIFGEFAGTIFFLFFGLASAQVALSKPDTLAKVDITSTPPSLLQNIYISFGFGLGLTVNVFIFFRVSGGMFNPAVTFGLCLAGAIPWIKALLLIPAQLLGGIVSALLVSAIFPGKLNVQTTLGGGASNVQGLMIEMMVTCQLVFTILMLAVEKHRATPLAPLGIGLALFVGHIVALKFTGASLNPARTFGPAVVLRDFVPYQWIYWLGPALGALLAVGMYKILKWMEYQTANPGQDDDGLDIFRIVHKRERGSSESEWVRGGEFSVKGGV